MKCRVINCTKEAIEEHHITYYPEATTLMCSEHHEQITAINSHQARKQHHELSNSQRWYLFYRFIQGNLRKPRITHLDLEWENNEYIMR